MKQDIRLLQKRAHEAISAINSEEDLEKARIAFLGRKGEINTLVKKLSHLPLEKRKKYGIKINELKVFIQKKIDQKLKEIRRRDEKKSRTFFDVTYPYPTLPLGHLHLVSQAIEEIVSIFSLIGFNLLSYPEVEYDWYAFESLNMQIGHPARDEWETFFIDLPANKKLGEVVLTPHTSNGQVREMERVKHPPIRMINIGKTYRRQSDISHNPMFHQFEGLCVDKGIGIPDLKGVMEYFVREYFGKNRKIRLRPFHFQFTEPSFEIDISCDICLGKGCRLCKQGWLELGGAGMTHPKVLKSGGIDPDTYTAFAFGWGIERVVMMKEGIKIPDIRMLYSTDLRFLEQF